MKFQLPPGTFPALELSREDMDNMENVASLLVDAAVAEYADFRRAVRGGTADRARWKPLKHRDGINVFQERVATTPSIRPPRKGLTRSRSAPLYKSDNIQSLLAVGCVPGDVRDALLGLLNTTREQSQFKAACTSDGVTDSAVLASIVLPTPSNPQRQLLVKWSAAGARSSAAAALAYPFGPVKARDLVYIEATGMALTESGEQIAYSLVHSVEIPGIRKLREYNLVRANVSVCSLFRQKQAGVVEMYVKGCIDPRGSIRPSLTLAYAAEALLSYRHVVHCAQMKKLAWMVACGDGTLKSGDVGDLTGGTRTSLLSTLTSSYHDRASSGTEGNPAKTETVIGACNSCQRRLRGGPPLHHRRRVCDVCENPICSVCVVPSHLPRRVFLRAVAASMAVNVNTCEEVAGEPASSSWSKGDDRLVVCRRCFDAAERTDALDVAMDDARRALTSSSGMDSALMASATSLFSLINSDRFDSKDFFFFNVH